jgi:small-conductance mechanosensitive channel
MRPIVDRVARPHLIRATIAAAAAVAGLIVAHSSGDPANASLIEKLKESTSVEEINAAPEDFLATAGAVLFVLGAVLAVRAVSRGLNRALEHRLGDARGAPLGFMVTAVGYLLVIFPALDLLGVNVGGLLLGGAVTGVVVGIAAQQTLGNIFAGMVLLFVRPFVVGDHIVLRSGPLGGEYAGQVTDIGLFYVDLVTEDGPVKLPNAGVLAGAIGPGAHSPAEEEDLPEEAQQTGEQG